MTQYRTPLYSMLWRWQILSRGQAPTPGMFPGSFQIRADSFQAVRHHFVLGTKVPHGQYFPNGSRALWPAEVELEDNQSVCTRFQATSTHHSFRWEPDRVSFLSLLGAYASNPEANRVINQWTFSQPAAVQKPASETVRINLWLFNGKAPSEGEEVEVVINRFCFLPSSIPQLSVSLDGPDIVLSWPSTFPGFTLEHQGVL